MNSKLIARAISMVLWIVLMVILASRSSIPNDYVWWVCCVVIGAVGVYGLAITPK